MIGRILSEHGMQLGEGQLVFLHIESEAVSQIAEKNP